VFFYIGQKKKKRIGNEAKEKKLFGSHPESVAGRHAEEWRIYPR